MKNFVPAISVEGFEEATDSRRGAGTYQAVMKAMQVLKEHKLPFGISCCYTSQNLDSISSEAFIDDMVARGAKFAWYFHYMPVGNDAVPELLPTPEQREKMVERIRGFRETKPIFALDFQNDGEYRQGMYRRRPALPAHQRQRRHGALRVHPLLRLQHLRQDACWRP